MSFKILIIDDEPTLRESLQIAFSAAGYEVTAVSTGEEGLIVMQKTSLTLFS